MLPGSQARSNVAYSKANMFFGSGVVVPDGGHGYHDSRPSVGSPDATDRRRHGRQAGDDPTRAGFLTRTRLDGVEMAAATVGVDAESPPQA